MCIVQPRTVNARASTVTARASAASLPAVPASPGNLPEEHWLLALLACVRAEAAVVLAAHGVAAHGCCPCRLCYHAEGLRYNADTGHALLDCNVIHTRHDRRKLAAEVGRRARGD